uniref:G_PROTEIN_RECEP_F1_2 domain-containing protein n=1 Tax=Panagrellus redivivus TaxID=6233 RepID=A0A7E4UQP4_PANRE
MSIQTATKCVYVEMLADSMTFKCVKAAKIAIDLTGILLIWFESRLKKKTSKMFHPNAAVIINFIRIVLMVNCMAYILINAYDLYRVLIPVTSPCDRLANIQIIIVLRLITVIANVTNVASFQMIAIERIICTMFVLKYENSSRPMFVLAMLLLLSSTYAGLACFAIFYHFGPMSSSILSGAKTSYNTKSYLITTISVVIGTIIVAVLFIVIRVWNARIARRFRAGTVNYYNQQFILSMKFQLKETVKIMDCFIPIAFGFGFLYVLSNGLIVVVNYLLKTPEAFVTYAWLSEAIFFQTLTAHVFAIVRMYKAGAFSKVSSTSAQYHDAAETTEAYYQRQNNWFALEGPKHSKNGSRSSSFLNKPPGSASTSALASTHPEDMALISVKWRRVLKTFGWVGAVSALVILGFTYSGHDEQELVSINDDIPPQPITSTSKPIEIESNPSRFLSKIDENLQKLDGFSTVNCEACFNNDTKAINTASKWVYPDLRNSSIWNDIENANYTQCEALKSAFVFPDKPFSVEEAEYPLAYGALVHKNIDQVTYMLSALYHPQNVYAFSVDGKASDEFKRRMNILGDCLPNVYIMHQSKVKWGGYEIVRAVFNNLKLLASLKHNWKYFQYLSGVDIPLKTNLEMVRIFKQLNNTFNGEIAQIQRSRINKKNPPPVPLFKSSLSATFPRAGANKLIASEKVRQLIEYLKLTFCPDESMWGTIFGNPKAIPIPGSFDGTKLLHARLAEINKKSNVSPYPPTLQPGEVFQPTQYYISRFQLWMYGGNRVCYGKSVSSSCVFGVGNLPQLITRAELVAHKMYLEIQPATFFCMLRRHWARAVDVEQQSTFRADAYSKLAQVEAAAGVPANKLRFYYSDHSF